jgi:hypothetical protein
MSNALVETFEDVAQVESYNAEQDSDEAKAAAYHRECLCNRLSLKGQTELPAVPFEPMSESEKRVYQTLCPADEDIKSYTRSTIPTRILELLDRWGGLFTKIRIWSDGKADPLVIGFISDGWNAQPYLLARWGNELLDFPSLCEKAITKRTLLERAKAEELLATSEARTRTYMLGGASSMYS